MALVPGGIQDEGRHADEILLIVEFVNTKCEIVVCRYISNR